MVESLKEIPKSLRELRWDDSRKIIDLAEAVSRQLSNDTVLLNKIYRELKLINSDIKNQNNGLAKTRLSKLGTTLAAELRIEEPWTE